MSRCAATAENRSAKPPSRCGRARTAHTVAEGDGPVNALDSALRAALVKFYPQAQKDRADRLQGAHPGFRDRHRRAKTRVLIQSTDGNEEWGTVGVSDNIIEASLQALVDSMEYALMRQIIEPDERGHPFILDDYRRRCEEMSSTRPKGVKVGTARCAVPVAERSVRRRNDPRYRTRTFHLRSAR